ncbi:hypothetical protein BV898_11193 [Hypsibius exemplaris]|uniref:Receptor ligand binding region domain-containing protein n=1 Tax=Hypsibius exemplaris TaxID=2072580 RepID=A0A1W0WH94_HYPEX|nr:hypothetical protein BV898_11193 [Hypsibius exemplaris]
MRREKHDRNSVRTWAVVPLLHLLSWLSMAGTVSGKLSVEIVTMGYAYGNPTGPSLMFQGPALELSAIHMNRTYNETMDVKHTWLIEKRIRSCPEMIENSDYIMSKWYYDTSRKPANVTAFITSACGPGEAINSNRLAGHWDVLYMSTAQSDATLRNAPRSPTWVTTSHNTFSSYTRLYLNLFQRYGWTTLFVIYDESSMPSLTGMWDSLQAATADTSSKLTKTVRKVNSRASINYADLLSDFHKGSRVLLLFANAGVLRKLMVQAALMNLTTEEYVYITVEPFKFALLGNLTWQYGDEFDEIARKAFQSVLVLQPLVEPPLTADIVRELAPTFIEMSQREFNFSYTISEMNGPGMTSSYAGVSVFGQVVQEALNMDPPFHFASGRAWKRLFLNRTFQTDAGEIYIDEKGERANNLSIAYFDGNSTRCIAFLTQRADVNELVQLGDDFWPGWQKDPPSNEPECGFQGNAPKCLDKASRILSMAVAVAVTGSVILIGITLMILWMRAHHKTFVNDPSRFMMDKSFLIFREEHHSKSTLCLTSHQSAVVPSVRALTNGEYADHSQWAKTDDGKGVVGKRSSEDATGSVTPAPLRQKNGTSNSNSHTFKASQRKDSEPLQRLGEQSSAMLRNL